MEGEIFCANFLPPIQQRLIPCVAPVLLVAIGYIDPGKWAAAVEGGAHFGLDLVPVLLLFNFAAILCQYLSSHIGVVTGRDLFQIFHDEYDKSTCVFLGVQAELSVIALNLTMMLGIAHGFNLVLGVDFLTSLSLSIIDVVLTPFFAPVLENWMGRFPWTSMSGFIMLSYIIGALISQPEIPFSMDGVLTRVSGESAFTLMSLLGASIVPHNFYVHSYFVKQHQGLSKASKGALSYDHFFAILCVFSGIFLVNAALLNLAANVFHNTGLVFVTFQDVFSLMDQVLRSPIICFGFLLVLLFSNQMFASTWSHAGQIILHDFFNIRIPARLHCAAIKFIAVLLALYSAWISGAEGMYRLLLVSQVIIALMLPSSFIPLFRVALSKSIMGTHKISSLVEFFALITFIGMFGLKVIFVVEMIFGESEWVGVLRWNMGNNITSVSYLVLLIVACASFCLMLWLLATPLKSASFRIIHQSQKWDLHKVEPDKESEMNDFHNSLENSAAGSLSVSVPDVDVDKSELTLVQKPSLITVELEHAQSGTVIEDICSSGCHDVGFRGQLVDPVEKRTAGTESEFLSLKNDESDNRQPDAESLKMVSRVTPSFPSESPGSGLGRAMRSRLAEILNKFWEQFYDCHGQSTMEAKAKGLDIMMGAGPKFTFSLQKSVANCGLFGSPQLPSVRSSVQSPYRVQRPSSSPLWSRHVQLLDAYVQNSSRNAFGTPRLCDGQPATVHGYPIASNLDQAAKNRISSAFSLGQTLQNGPKSVPPPGFEDRMVFRNSSMRPERSYDDHTLNAVNPINSKKYHTLPNISLLAPQRGYMPVGQTIYEHSPYSGADSSGGTLFHSHDLLSSGSDFHSLRTSQPFQRALMEESATVDSEREVLQSLRHCVLKLLKLEGSDWLFRQNDGLDEDLIGHVASWERFHYEAGSPEINQLAHMGVINQKSGASSLKNDDSDFVQLLISTIPRCGERCIWKVDLVVSFGVWCIHRILELLCKENRPDLWGKYTYVLNRLQGIIDLAFSKPRSLKPPCSCIEIHRAHQQGPGPLLSNGGSGIAVSGACTSACELLGLVKAVEDAISQQKGRGGSGASDAAFRKGKENLVPALKRYARRLSGKPA